MIYVGRDIFGQLAYLEDDAARSYVRMRAAGCPEGITSALRSHAQQVALFLSRYRRQDSGVGPYGDVRWYLGQRYVRFTGAAVAVPGSATARHELGLSLDLPAGGPREWVRAHGAMFGWIKDVVRDESWHMEYQRHRDARRTEATTVSNPGATTGGELPDVDVDPLDPLKPKPTPPRRRPMFALKVASGAWYLVVPEGFTEVNDEERQLLTRLWNQGFEKELGDPWLRSELDKVDAAFRRARSAGALPFTTGQENQIYEKSKQVEQHEGPTDRQFDLMIRAARAGATLAINELGVAGVEPGPTLTADQLKQAVRDALTGATITPA